MIEQSVQKERHDYLAGFTIAAIIAAIITILGVLTSIPKALDQLSLGYSWSGSGLRDLVLWFTAAVLVIAGGWHTLRVTKGFEHWDQGISNRDKVIGWLVITVGFMVSLLLIMFLFAFIGALRKNSEDR
jgi:heme/copper-type cytochrome/quinol oxidase subunit 2